MPRRLIAASLLVFVPWAAAACGSSSTPATTTTAGTRSGTIPGSVPGTTAGTTPGSSVPAGTPVIFTFNTASEVTCTGSTAPVKATWTSTNVAKIGITIDNKSDGKTYDPNGSASLTIPCDDKSHTVTVVAYNAAGKDVAAVSHSIQTATNNPPGDAPIIQTFTITPAQNIPCTGAQGAATMAWNVSPTDVAISFLVDGQSSGAAQAGFLNSMTGQSLPVNFVCDGRGHQVTLVATDSGGSTQASVSVTTTNAGAGTTTTTKK